MVWVGGAKASISLALQLSEWKGGIGGGQGRECSWALTPPTSPMLFTLSLLAAVCLACDCWYRCTAQVLLLDEITVDMDVVGRLDLLHFFKQECEERGATIVYVSVEEYEEEVEGGP